MATPNVYHPPTFAWTEEERALLQRTLHIRALEEDRIEVETLDPRQVRSLSTTLIFVAPALAIAALVVAFGTSVSPQGLVVPTWTFAFVPIVGLLMVLGMPRGRVKPSEPVTLFADTPWCVRHRQPQNCLEILQRPSVDATTLDRRTVPLDTDVGPLFLRVARRTPVAVRLRLRQLILGRCASAVPGAEPPEKVVSLVGAEVARLPRAFYVALQEDIDVVSVTPETLTIRTRPSLPFVMVFFFLMEFLLLPLVPLFMLAIGAWMESITLGTPESAWICRLVLFWGLTFLAPIHGMIEDLHTRRNPAARLTFSKESTFITLSDRHGERQLPSGECRFRLDEYDDSDVSYKVMTLSLYHSKKLLGRWSFTEDKPSSGKRRALEKGLHEYLRSGSLRDASTGAAAEDEE